MFVNGKLESVSDDKGNTIYIKAKMDIRTAGQVSADLARMGAATIIAHEVCLLRRNIVRWAGPDFKDDKGNIIPCTPERIDTLDPNEPIVGDVLAKIRELNKRQEAEVTLEETKADPTPAAVAT